MKMLAMMRVKKLSSATLSFDSDVSLSEIPRLEMEWLLVKEIDSKMDKNIEFIIINALLDRHLFLQIILLNPFH